MTPDLKAKIWIPALLRRAEVNGAFACVVRKGDADGGTALVKVRTPNGNAVLYRPVRNMDGARVWWPKGPSPEREIDAYMNARLDDDPDLWIIEIEDRDGRHFLTDPVETEK